jgi:hypothetical protein
MFVAVFTALVLAAVVTWAHSGGWFWWLILGETIGAVILYASLRVTLTKVKWSSIE